MLTNLITKDKSRTFKFLITNIAVLNLLDFILTYIALEYMNVLESNIIMVGLIDFTGSIWIILLIKTFFMLFIIVPYYKIPGVKERWEHWDGILALFMVALIYFGIVVRSIFHTVLHSL